MLHQVNITDILFSGMVKPDYIRISRRNHRYFCPYCNEVHMFKRDSRLGVRRCTGCGISDRDFYIKKLNKLEMIR